MKKKLIIPLVITSLLIGGCSLNSSNKITQDDYDSAIEERDELKDQVKELKSQVRTLKKENSGLAKEENPEVIETAKTPETVKYDVMTPPELSDEELSDLLKGVTYTATETSKELVVVFVNSSNDTIPNFKANVVFYGESNNILSTSNDNIVLFGAGQTIVLTFRYPNDVNYNRVEHERYEISFSSSTYNSRTNEFDHVSVETNIGSRNQIYANVTNNSDHKIEYIRLVTLFYKDEKIIGCSNKYTNDLAAGASSILEFNAPYDDNFNVIEYDSYDVIINETYSYLK